MLTPSAQYDYQHWYKLVPDHSLSQVIMLSTAELKQLRHDKPIDLLVTISYPVFVRLTSRSPKDCTSEAYEYDCKAESMSDIMRMILLSQRCTDDIIDYYESDMPLGIVLQPFNHDIKLRKEYRLFIFNCNLVAVSAVTEPNDLLNEDDLRMLKSYIESLTDLHKHFTQYIADIAMCNHKFVFIEINPYCPAIVDGMLFNWEEDKRLLFPESTPSIPLYRYD